jgi:polysaccharide pyruvyl transferase WcaK-like protein
VEASYHGLLEDLLGKLFAIGVREKSGLELVRQLSGQEPAWVPDPALLLSDYDEITESPIHENDYLMSYVLRSGEGIGEVQQYIANCLGLEVIVPYNRQRRWKGIGTEVVCTPGQWLGLIKNARIVVTNSFHGTVFSILFRKPFVTVALPGNKACLNERMVSMLDRLGLSGRMLQNNSGEGVMDIINEEIDWHRVHEKLEVWRLEAKTFLECALK